ncbi:MAG: endonuclease/exonuclease/phosphatase family protein [Bacteroidota bacterium]
MAGTFYRFMTYNIHGGVDRRGRPSLPAAAATIAAIRPDLAGLQEVERGFRARGGFADQPFLLAEALGYQCRFAAALDRDPGGSGGKFGNAVLSALPIISSWAAPLPHRGESRAVMGVSVRASSDRLHFLVCHLGLDREERREQVWVILRRAEALRGPVILAGDFNAPPDAPELSPLFTRWREAQNACGLDRATFPSSGARIDYIFLPPEWRVLKAQIVPSPASDHRPLVVDAAPPARRVGRGERGAGSDGDKEKGRNVAEGDAGNR